MTQPCLVPFVTGKASAVIPKPGTHAIIPPWNERMILILLLLQVTVLVSYCQGPRSNFEIGGAWLNIGGGTMHFFLLTLYNFKNIGGHVPPCAPPPPSPYSSVTDYEGFTIKSTILTILIMNIKTLGERVIFTFGLADSKVHTTVTTALVQARRVNRFTWPQTQRVQSKAVLSLVKSVCLVSL